MKACKHTLYINFKSALYLHVPAKPMTKPIATTLLFIQIILCYMTYGCIYLTIIHMHTQTLHWNHEGKMQMPLDDHMHTHSMILTATILVIGFYQNCSLTTLLYP